MYAQFWPFLKSKVSRQCATSGGDNEQEEHLQQREEEGCGEDATGRDGDEPMQAEGDRAYCRCVCTPDVMRGVCADMCYLRGVLDKEQEEKKESEASVAAFRRQLAAIKEKCASLDAEIELHRRNVTNLMRGTS